MLLEGYKVDFEPVWVGLELICARCAAGFRVALGLWICKFWASFGLGLVVGRCQKKPQPVPLNIESGLIGAPFFRGHWGSKKSSDVHAIGISIPNTDTCSQAAVVNSISQRLILAICGKLIAPSKLALSCQQ